MGRCGCVIILILIVNVSIGLRTYLEGYYWRDYEGVIPDDSLPGGLDRNGRPMYIGQALFDNRLVAGKIYENDNKIYFELGNKEHTQTKNVKILCSQYPHRFEWLPTKHDGVIRLTNRLLVKGGHEEGYSVYIGRVYIGGETVVGKVICGDTDCLGLYITKDGKGVECRDAFEVLSYNPNTNRTDISCPSKIESKVTAE